VGIFAFPPEAKSFRLIPDLIGHLFLAVVIGQGSTLPDFPFRHFIPIAPPQVAHLTSRFESCSPIELAPGWFAKAVTWTCEKGGLMHLSWADEHK